jgi:hypothetical protein
LGPAATSVIKRAPPIAAAPAVLTIAQHVTLCPGRRDPQKQPLHRVIGDPLLDARCRGIVHDTLHEAARAIFPIRRLRRRP